MNNNNTKIRLMKRGWDETETRCVTAVIRPAGVAQQWAKEKNRKLDFYGPLCWVVEK